MICILFIAHQPGNFYRDVLNAEEKDRLCRNIAGHLMNAVDFIRERAVSIYMSVCLCVCVRVFVCLSVCSNLCVCALQSVLTTIHVHKVLDWCGSM